MDRIQTRDDEIEALRQNGEIEERERDNILRAKRVKSIADVLEEVEVLIDTHIFIELYETKSSSFLKKVIANQGSIAMNLFKKTWRTLNCFPRTMKIIREIQENLLCVGRRRELITKKRLNRSAGAAKQDCRSTQGTSLPAAGK